MSQVADRPTPAGATADPAGGRHRRARSRYGLAVAGVTALSFVLGIVRLGADGLWRDEIFSAYIATRPLGQTWSILMHRELNMGLYYLLLSAWTTVSDSEAWIRSLSVVAATATIPVTAAIARRLGGTRVALLAALFLALNPGFLYYERFARAYALTTFLVCIATLCLLRVLDRPGSRGRWALYVVVCVLMVTSTPLSLLVVGAHALALLVVRPWPVDPRAGVVAYLVIGVLVAPLMLRLLTGQGVMSDWIEPLSPGRIAGAAADLSGNAVLVPVYGIAALAWLLALARARSAGRGTTPVTALVTSWLLLPPLVIVVVSVVKPLLVGRYLAFVLPAMAIVLAWAVAQVPARRTAAALLAVVVTVDVLCLVERDYLRPEPEDVRAAAWDVTGRSRPGDIVLYGPAHLRMAITWYLDRRPAGDVAPEDVAVQRTEAEMGDEFPQEFSPAQLAPVVEQHDRVWVVTMPGDGWRPVPESASRVIADTVRPGYRQAYERSYGTIKVQLYERATGSSGG